MKKCFFGTFWGIILVFAFLFSISCNKSLEIGSELLEQDQAKVTFTDTLTVQSSTVTEDSVLVFSYTNGNYLHLSTSLCGEVDDPVFGTTKADIYTQFCLPTTGAPSFKNLTIDSLVLHLAYDSLGIYGDLNQSHSLEVFRVTEVMDTLQPYYSTRKFATGATPIGAVYNFVPRFVKDSVVVLSSGAEASAKGYRLSIPLDKSLATELANIDSTTYATNAAFVNIFRGLYVRSAKKTNTMLSFNFNSTLTDLVLYYRTSSNVQGRFYLQTRAACPSTNYFQQNLSARVRNAVNNPKTGDNLVYLQGMSGPNVKIELPTLQNLPKNIIVNKAELEVTVAAIDGDNTALYPPPPQLILDPFNNSLEEYLSDVAYAINQQSLRATFGGAPTTVDGKIKYTFNISNYVHLLRQKPEAYSNAFYIKPYIKPQVAARTVFFGPKSTTYPMKLRLTYTTL